jgi:hypothetical protein
LIIEHVPGGLAYDRRMPKVRQYLRRYWFRFEASEVTTRAGGGIGVGATGVDRADAAKLIQQRLFEQAAMPAVIDVVEDVDVRELDSGHVRPNMGDPTVRGVWYPRV